MNPLVFTILMIERQNQARQEKFLSQYHNTDCPLPGKNTRLPGWIQRLCTAFSPQKPEQPNAALHSCMEERC